MAVWKWVLALRRFCASRLGSARWARPIHRPEANHEQQGSSKKGGHFLGPVLCRADGCSSLFHDRPRWRGVRSPSRDAERRAGSDAEEAIGLMEPRANPEEIEDAIQTACKRFLEHAHDISNPGQVYSWLRTTASRILSREAELRHREIAFNPTTDGGVWAIPDDDSGPVEALVELKDDADLEMLVREVSDGECRGWVGSSLKGLAAQHILTTAAPRRPPLDPRRDPSCVLKLKPIPPSLPSTAPSSSPGMKRPRKSLPEGFP